MPEEKYTLLLVIEEGSQMAIINEGYAFLCLCLSFVIERFKTLICMKQEPLNKRKSEVQCQSHQITEHQKDDESEQKQEHKQHASNH